MRAKTRSVSRADQSEAKQGKAEQSESESNIVECDAQSVQSANEETGEK